MDGCEASSAFELALFLREGRGIVWLAAMVNAGGWQLLMAVRLEAGHTMAGPGRDARHAQPGASLDPHCRTHHPYPPPIDAFGNADIWILPMHVENASICTNFRSSAKSHFVESSSLQNSIKPAPPPLLCEGPAQLLYAQVHG